MNKESDKISMLKSQAVRQAMFEVLGEQRAEVVKRARAKLVAMGIEFSDDDFDVTPASRGPLHPQEPGGKVD